MFKLQSSMRGMILKVAVVCFLLAIITPGLPLNASGPFITPGAELVVVYSASRFMEGPTWDPITEKLYFTSLTGDMQILRLEPPDTMTVWRNNSQIINGTYLSLDNRLLCAHSGAREILSLGIGPTGPTDEQVLASDPSWFMPNDICQTSSGNIYFTTPDFSGPPGSSVWLLEPDGTTTEIITDMMGPNGVIASNDGQTLYVSDSPRVQWRSYPILPDGTVGPGSVFFEPIDPPTPSYIPDLDGMSVDEFGNLYLTGRGALWIVSPAGEELERLETPVFCSNVTFGGVHGRTLYLTGDTKLYSLSMEVRGAAWRDIPDDNEPPQVSVGQDQTITTRTDCTHLDGTVTDDGKPDPPGQVTPTWYKVSGPGQVEFGDQHAVDTTASFSEVGRYILRLLAFDGIRTSADELTITVLQVADFNGDKDVDQADFNTFYNCITGPNLGPPAQGCNLADIDEDGDVDLSDFGLFQRCLCGDGNLADPTCAD